LFKGDRLAESIREMNAKNFDTNRPTIGFYGKVGEVKGSFDLLVALEKLADEGIEFNFLTIAGGTTKTHAAYSRAILNSELLSRCSWLFPFIAPWRIPSFLRRCDIACFLEREFPIEFHGSSIPREILAAGCCLVCSEEMARKQPFRSNLVDGKNYIVIRDPRDVDELAASLRNILTGDNNREIIAAHGKFLSKFWEQQCPAFGGMAEAIERIGLENFPAAELGCGLN
jgi:glycosyltransferase involved in cell wall biosynthesis